MQDTSLDKSRARSIRETVADKHGAMLLHRQFRPVNAPAYYARPFCVHEKECTVACIECRDGFVEKR